MEDTGQMFPLELTENNVDSFALPNKVDHALYSKPSTFLMGIH